MAGPEGHPLPSISCELNKLLLSAGGIRDVPLRRQKAALEIRWAHPSVLTQSFCGFELQTKPQRVHRAWEKSRQHLPRAICLDIES